MDSYKRSLIQLGNKSLVVSIPWQIAEELGLTKGQKMTVSLDGDGTGILVTARSEDE